MPTRNYTTSTLNGAAPGLSRLAMALGGGQQAFQHGQDAENLNQSRMAQALSQIGMHQAQADKFGADAAQTRAETALVGQRPQQYQELAALSSGSALPLVQAVMEATRSGAKPTIPGAEMLPGPNPDGSAGVAPLVPPEVQSKIAQALVRLAPVAMNGKDFKVDDWAQAQGAYRNQDLGDDVLAGRRSAGDVGRSQAAVAAKPLYNAEANGSVLDLFGGALDTNNPMARGTIELKGAQAGQARAGAAENKAQAAAATALATLRNNQSGAIGAGPGRVPVGYRYTSDPDTGAVRLEPIPGGPKDPNAQTGKPLPASTAKGHLENLTNLTRAETALSLVEGGSVGDATGDPNATGWKGLLPNGILNRMDPKGVDTRAAISDLGSLVIHDRSGAAVTAAEMPRLAPFIPSATDDPVTVKKKLRQFVHNYRGIVDSASEFYKASGYNVPTMPAQRAQPTAPTGAPAPTGLPAGWTITPVPAGT